MARLWGKREAAHLRLSYRRRSSSYRRDVDALVHTQPLRTATLVAGGLPRATGLVLGADGALYVSVNGASAGNGAVWRIEP
jgi:glucose/arabinose dehydrogenase